MDVRRVLKVVFTSDPQSHEPNDAVVGIRRNNFMFREIAENEFLVFTPGPHYGGEEEMEADLNDNAVRGTYTVSRASRAEIDAFDRAGAILHN
jgi:hypothetical protein